MLRILSDLHFRDAARRRLVIEFWPPRQPLAMLHAWHSLPDRVAAVAPR